ncbi:MAG: hypothetical protein JO264_17980 [Acidisphaera sp.]|nr:hypothetical protein [Acidisphaera sp.]
MNGVNQAGDRAGMAAMPEVWQAEAEKLLAAVRRGLSTPKARVALVLRLSLLAPPLPRAHHRRIARAILEASAQQHQGEMFELFGGDMVLLCRVPSVDVASERALHPASLPQAMARLFRADVPGSISLATLWSLERDSTALLAYTAEVTS